MDDRPREALGPGERGGVATVIAVVAGAHQQERAGQRQRLAGRGALHGHHPATLLGAPARAGDAMTVADAPGHAVPGRRLADVAQDRRAVGQRARVLPRRERIAERVHVGVRADPRIAEQVPRAADLVARLEDRVAAVGTVAHEMAGGADARQAGADDQHVAVFGDRGTHAYRGSLADGTRAYQEVRAAAYSLMHTSTTKEP